MTREKIVNRLLRSVPTADFDLLAPHLKPVRLELRQTYEMQGRPVEQICFPDSGMLSVVTHSENGRSIETAVVGYEGMSGVAVLLGSERSTSEAFVQIAGVGHVIAADNLREALNASIGLHKRLLQYAQSFMTLTAQTALAHGRAKIDERLARWLLMASDRVEGGDLPLTHELLSLMLGVRRPGVTDALHRLEGEQMIRAKRSSITIRDRAALEKLAAGSYGFTEREYERLFGPLPTPRGAGERAAAVSNAA